MRSVPMIAKQLFLRWGALALVLSLALVKGDVTPAFAACGTTNIALNKTATASSVTGTNTASLAVDGNNGSRWESLYSDPQWLQVDLGSTQSICKVTIIWETAYGKAYQIQASNDATN